MLSGYGLPSKENSLEAKRFIYYGSRAISPKDFFKEISEQGQNVLWG